MIINSTVAGSGGGGFLVTFTTPDSGTTYTADKTFAEIHAALDSGIQPSIKVNGSSSMYFVSINRLIFSSSATCSLTLTNFYTYPITGSANDYPSWTSDN